jgi:hypothetical protein
MDLGGHVRKRLGGLSIMEIENENSGNLVPG